MARWHGVQSLDPGHPISAADLEEVVRAKSIELHQGDTVIVRTGYLAECRSRGWQGYFDDAPGLAIDSLDWIHDRRIAAVATDTVAVEVKPSQVAGVVSPLHVAAIVYMGLLLGEMFDLEELAQECVADGICDFFFVAAPLPVTGGTGSPINPYAIR